VGVFLLHEAIQGQAHRFCRRIRQARSALRSVGEDDQWQHKACRMGLSVLGILCYHRTKLHPADRRSLKAWKPSHSSGDGIQCPHPR